MTTSFWDEFRYVPHHYGTEKLCLCLVEKRMLITQMAFAYNLYLSKTSGDIKYGSAHISHIFN